jgi:hypothetical protein
MTTSLKLPGSAENAAIYFISRISSKGKSFLIAGPAASRLLSICQKSRFSRDA